MKPDAMKPARYILQYQKHRARPPPLQRDYTTEDGIPMLDVHLTNTHQPGYKSSRLSTTNNTGQKH
jgi:hypothetical protein